MDLSAPLDVAPAAPPPRADAPRALERPAAPPGLCDDDAPPSVPPPMARMALAVRALRTLLRDPNRLDQVLLLAQAVNARVAAAHVGRIARTREGAELFAERPRIDRTHVDFDELRRLPDGTLGREYTRFLDDHGIGPEPFEALPEVGDPRIAWLMLRFRQTHDLWHVLTGYAPDVEGEILLQAFTYAQTGVPSALLIAALGTLRWAKLAPSHARKLLEAHRRGKATARLATFRWERHWATPVETLRRELTCPV